MSEPAPGLRRRYLLIIPLLLFILSGVLAGNSEPHSIGYSSDPDYPYLFNALNILTLDSPRHTDHPGTTMQEFGAAVVYGKWWIQSLAGSSRPIEEAVLADPESYLHAINVALNLLICVLVFACARNIYRYSGVLLPAVLFECAVWLFSQTVIAQTRVSPEPFLIAVDCAFFLIWLPYLFGSEPAVQSLRSTTAWRSGALFAFGMVTKVTFFPFCVFCLLLSGRKQFARFWIAFVCAVLVLTLPIFSQLKRVAAWLWGIVIHTGTYGAGKVGLPSWEQYSHGLRFTFHTEPYLFVVLFYMIGILCWSLIAREMKRSSRFLLLACVAIALQIAVTSEHTAPHYIVPVLLIPAFVAALVCRDFLTSANRQIASTLAAATGALILLLGIGRCASSVQTWLSASQDYQREVRKLAATGPRDCTRIGFYQASLPSFALSFGNVWSERLHAGMLDSLYPGSLIYTMFTDRFERFDGTEVPFADIQTRIESGECILVQGAPQFGAPAKLSEKLTLTPVLTGTHESLYRLNLKALPTTSFTFPPDAVVIEAERFSSGSVVPDMTVYGAGIGVITSPKIPAYVEYEVHLKELGTYTIRARYATLEPRPLKVTANGTVVTENAFSVTTGGFGAEKQMWIKLGKFNAHPDNILRLAGDGPFPHIDKLVLVRELN